MSVVTQNYLDTLPEIYRDILAVFPEIEPARKVGWGLAYQTLYERLHQGAASLPKGASLSKMAVADNRARWSLGEIIEACQNMERGGAIEIKQGIFVCPTPLGEEMITLLTGKKAGEYHVPAFPSPAQG